MNPPKGYVPVNLNPDEDQIATSVKTGADMGTAQVLRSLQFWKLWVLFFIGSGAGLMVIGNVASMAKASMGAAAFVAGGHKGGGGGVGGGVWGGGEGGAGGGGGGRLLFLPPLAARASFQHLRSAPTAVVSDWGGAVV